MYHERCADEHDAAIVRSEGCWEWRAFACSLAFRVVMVVEVEDSIQKWE